MGHLAFSTLLEKSIKVFKKKENRTATTQVHGSIIKLCNLNSKSNLEIHARTFFATYGSVLPAILQETHSLIDNRPEYRETSRHSH